MRNLLLLALMVFSLPSFSKSVKIYVETTYRLGSYDPMYLAESICIDDLKRKAANIIGTRIYAKKSLDSKGEFLNVVEITTGIVKLANIKKHVTSDSGIITLQMSATAFVDDRILKDKDLTLRRFSSKTLKRELWEAKHISKKIKYLLLSLNKLDESKHKNVIENISDNINRLSTLQNKISDVYFDRVALEEMAKRKRVIREDFLKTFGEDFFTFLKEKGSIKKISVKGVYTTEYNATRYILSAKSFNIRDYIDETCSLLFGKDICDRYHDTGGFIVLNNRYATFNSSFFKWYVKNSTIDERLYFIRKLKHLVVYSLGHGNYTFEKRKFIKRYHNSMNRFLLRASFDSRSRPDKEYFHLSLSGFRSFIMEIKSGRLYLNHNIRFVIGCPKCNIDDNGNIIIEFNGVEADVAERSVKGIYGSFSPVIFKEY